jgi:hypothetical protein
LAQRSGAGRAEPADPIELVQQPVDGLGPISADRRPGVDGRGVARPRPVRVRQLQGGKPHVEGPGGADHGTVRPDGSTIIGAVRRQPAGGPPIPACDGPTAGARRTRPLICEGVLLAPEHIPKALAAVDEAFELGRREEEDGLPTVEADVVCDALRLLGRGLRSTEGIETPPSLLKFAAEHELPDPDVQLLAGIQFRGEHPQTKERWAYIYNAISTGRPLDHPEQRA